MEKKFKQAYASYQTLTERFPKSLEVTDAKSRMEEIGKAHSELVPAVAVTPTLSPVAETTPQATVTLTTNLAEEATPTPEVSKEEVVDQASLKLTPFHVQIGVYTQKVNVRKAQQAVKKAGYKSYVIIIKKEGEPYTYYKVRVGNYSTKSAALKAAKILHKKTKEKAIVVED
jgi:cell division septation protein DedD